MESSPYTLNNGPKGHEENRLDANHWNCFRPLMNGELLPPHIKAQLEASEDPAVADVATGTGVWLKDLATKLPPSARLDGYDFDTSKFHSPENLPGNVKLQFGNALEPFPDAVRGSYDVVHVRLVFYALQADQWETMAANLKTLLKPGGWLFWEELSYSSWICLPMSQSFYEWIGPEVRYAAKVGRDVSAPAKLKQQISNQGYTSCGQQITSSFSSTEAVRRATGVGVITAGYQSMMGIIKKGGFENIQTKEEAERLRDTMLADLDNGYEIGGEMWWVWGQN